MFHVAHWFEKRTMNSSLPKKCADCKLVRTNSSHVQHLLLVVALGLDLNYVDLILLGGGHQDRRLDEQPTGKVRSEWNTLIMMENKQIISHLCEGLPSSSVSSPSFTGSLRFRDNQLKLRLQAILITFSLGEPKSTPSWQRSSRSSTEIPQR